MPTRIAKERAYAPLMTTQSTNDQEIAKSRKSKYADPLRTEAKDPEPSSATANKKSRLAAAIVLSQSSNEDSGFDTPINSNHPRDSLMKKYVEEMKTTEKTIQETRGEYEPDPDISDYQSEKLTLDQVQVEKVVKESPVIDENKLEISPGHRRSGRSSSPHVRKKVCIEETGIKGSTNIPPSSLLSSEEEEQPVYTDDDTIPDELSALYAVFLDWMFSVKEEYADTSKTIRNSMMLPICLNLASKSTKLMNQRALTDLHLMTASEKNSSIIMRDKTFNRWILDILFTVFPPKTIGEKDPMWEMGAKLYVYLSKTCFMHDKNAHKHLHYIMCWPIKKAVQNKSRRETYRHEVRKKERMLRTLLLNFFETLNNDKERDKYPASLTADTSYKVFWYNCVNVFFYMEEMVLAFGNVFTNMESGLSSPYREKNLEATFNLDHSTTLMESPYNEQMYSGLKNVLFFSSKKQWHDARLIDTIFDILEPIWFIKAKRRSSKFKKQLSINSQKTGYIHKEDTVLDCLEEISSNDANDKIELLLHKKIISNDGILSRKETQKFYFLKSLVNMLCIRITLEEDKDTIKRYCRIIKDLGECLIYISENWVTQSSEESKNVQEKLSLAVGFIIYFLHKEIRNRDKEIKSYLKHSLNGIMSTIFIIVLKNYPKDHEHVSTETASAKVVSIVLNKLFEKEHGTLLFVRRDIETHKAKDYEEIANFLSSDQVHDFFEESNRFQFVRKEYCKHNYLDIIARERQNHAKKMKDEQDTWDYQEKKKFQELSDEIVYKNRKVRTEEEVSKKDNLMWIDHKQRTMKAYLRRMYNNLFTWRGVWRNKHMFDRDPENVPVKIFNFVTKNLSKPILKNMVTQCLCYYDEDETQKIIRRKNIDYQSDYWKLLNCKDVFDDNIYCELKYRFFSRKMTREDIEFLKKDYVNYLEKYVLSSGETKDQIL